MFFSALLRLEIKNEAAQKRNTSALPNSNGEDSIPSIRHLIGLSKEKLKEGRPQNLSQDVSRTPIIGSTIQQRANLSTGGSLRTDTVVACDACSEIMEIFSETKESINCATFLWIS